MTARTSKQSARMICDYLKKQPDQYAADPKSVQKALGLSEAEFKAGVDYCIERKIIVMEKPHIPTPITSIFSESSSKIFTEDLDSDMKSTAEVAAIKA